MPAVSAVSIGLIMWYLQTASPWLSGNDAYYHVKMAMLLPSESFMHAMPGSILQAMRYQQLTEAVVIRVVDSS